MTREYVIYADESVSDGPRFSNFYGGSLVRSEDLAGVVARLDACKQRLNLFGEVKWSKVTEQYLSKYVEVVNAYFDEVEAGRVKARVMFTQNIRPALGLTADQRAAGYFILYYQFVKHAFGLRYAQPGGRVRLLFDELPDTLEQRREFRSFLARLSTNAQFKLAGIYIDPNIGEVRSHDHVVLQCTDIVLGAMQFRLNDKHREKSPGAHRRGKRTIAKEKLYKAISARVAKLRPRFNIGISTGTDGDVANRWHHSYRHWLFTPKNPGGQPSVFPPGSRYSP